MRHASPDPNLIAVARGDRPADLALVNARVVNTHTREVLPGSVAIAGGRIARVSPGPIEAAETIDLAGAHVAPGFVDAHMHIESTMLPPSRFVTLAVPHGTTTVVADPHEIANVLGIDGIRWMMRDAEGLPCDILFTASSCVPSCHLETSGASLSASDLAPLFDDERVVALAEMMNFPGVVHADEGVLEKVALGLDRRLVDGHAPGLRGPGLQAYAAAGISSDHESVDPDEAREKLRAGLTVYIREGSAARNLEALLPIVDDRNAHRVCFCTDDRHPSDLAGEGHIDHVVRRAIALGMDPATAIACATLHPALHYRLPALGAVAPGRLANLITFGDPADLRPDLVLHRGVVVARGGSYLPEPAPLEPPPPPTVRLPEGLSEKDLAIEDPRADEIRVIGMDPHQIVTTEKRVIPASESGRLVADPARDLLKMVVVERHRASGAIGRGFVAGFGFQGGALASTIGHDAHNLAIVGDDDRDMLLAARRLEEVGGGQCVVSGGRVLATLPLPIAGLMSDRPAGEVIEQQAELLRAAASLGCPHHDPFMPLSFLCLPVIPRLKLTDLGLVDVDAFEVVPLGVPASG
jgi:adenine deaminase